MILINLRQLATIALVGLEEPQQMPVSISR